MLKAPFVIALQIISLLFATALAPVQAATVSTATYLESGQRQAQLARVDAVLAGEAVQAQLEELGVSHADAMARVAALTPAELQTLSQRLDELPAGGSLLGLVGAVFVVLLILELVGVTDVFTGV